MIRAPLAIPVAALLACVGARGPVRAPAPAPRWTGAQLGSDLARLRAVLDAVHPGLHRYLTARDLDAAFARSNAALAGGASTGAAFLELARLTAQLRCGHTFPNPHNQSEAVEAELLGGPRLPFAFRWTDGSMLVTRTFADIPGLSPGAVVTELDGVTAPELFARLAPLGRADGASDAKRVDSLAAHGGDRYEAFDVYLPLVAPEVAPPYRLILADGTTVTAAAVTPALRAAAEPTPEDDAPLWRLEWLDARTAYLRMPTWVGYKTRWDWQGDLHRIMAEVSARPDARLIVDVRGNEGGSSVGDVILAHVIAAPLPRRDHERWVRYRRVPDALRPGLDTWDPSFFDWGDDARATAADGWFRLADEEDADHLVPVAPRFTGRLIVLIDASNSSATFLFAARVRRDRLGTLVGEPTGGNLRGINGGAYFFLRLPATGIEIDIPLIGYYPPGRRVADVPNGGIVPDVVVPVTAADLRRGHDAALAAARALP